MSRVDPDALLAAQHTALDALESIPRGDDGPVFTAPWQARAFAMAVELNAAGAFEWREWAEGLGAALAEAEAERTDDWGETYYLAWLATLERVVAAKGLSDEAALAARRDAWARAARATPHGQPIELGAERPVQPR